MSIYKIQFLFFNKVVSALQSDGEATLDSAYMLVEYDQQNRLIKRVSTGLNSEMKEMEITDSYDYFENGKLKSQRTSYSDTTYHDTRGIGGSNKDIMYYEYEYDTKGRVLKEYVIINEKKQLLATYQYWDYK